MAGKTLKYSFKVVKVVEGKEEQVMALLESNTGHSDFGVAFDGDDLNITIPQTMLFDTNAAMMKFRLVPSSETLLSAVRSRSSKSTNPVASALPTKKTMATTVKRRTSPSSPWLNSRNASRPPDSPLVARRPTSSLAFPKKKSESVGNPIAKRALGPIGEVREHDGR